MATNSLGELVLEFKADISDFQAKLSAVGTAVRGLAEPLTSPFQKMQTVVGAAAIALDGYLGVALNAAIQSEELAASLRSLVYAQTQSVDEAKLAVDQTKQLGTALANSSLFTRGDTIRAMQQLTTMTGDWRKSLAAIGPAADLAAAKGWDLTTAANLLGRAMNQNYSFLSRYGLLTKTEVKNLQGFGDVLDAISRKFGGMKLSQLDETAGQLKQFQQRMSSFQSSMGGAFLQTLRPVIVALNQFAGILFNLDDDTKNLISRVLSLAAVFGSLLAGGRALNALFGQIPIVNALIRPLSGLLTKFGPWGAAILAFSMLFRDQFNAIIETAKNAGKWVAEHINGIIVALTLLFIVLLPYMITTAAKAIKDKWLPAVGNLGSKTVAALKAAGKVITDSGQLWKGLIKTIGDGIGKLPALFSKLKNAFGTVMTVIRNVNFSSIAASLGELAGPIAIAIAILAALYLAWRFNFLGIRDLVQKFCDWVMSKFQWIANAINWLKEKIGQAKEKMAETINDINKKLGIVAPDDWTNSVETQADKAREKFEKMRDEYNEFYDTLKSALKSYLEAQQDTLEKEQENLKTVEDERWENEQDQMDKEFTERQRRLEDQIDAEQFAFDQQLAAEKQLFEDRRDAIEHDYSERERILDDGVNAILDANNAEIAALRGIAREADLERDFINKSLEIEARQAELETLANRTDPEGVARRRALQSEILKLEADYQRDLTKAAIDARVDQLETENQATRDAAEDQKTIWEREKQDKLDTLQHELDQQGVLWEQEKFNFNQHLTDLKRREEDYQTGRTDAAETNHKQIIAGYDAELERIKADYAALTSEASLSAATLEMIQKGELQTMQMLLDTYAPDYKMKATQMGNALVAALEGKKDAFDRVVNSYVAAIERLKNEMASVGSGGGGGGNTTTPPPPTTVQPTSTLPTRTGVLDSLLYWTPAPPPTPLLKAVALPKVPTPVTVSPTTTTRTTTPRTTTTTTSTPVAPRGDYGAQRAYAEGGLVPRTMTALVHQGEFVLSLDMLERVKRLLQSIRSLNTMSAGVNMNRLAAMGGGSVVVDMGGVNFHFSGSAPQSRRELTELADKVGDVLYAKLKRRL